MIPILCRSPPADFALTDPTSTFDGGTDPPLMLLAPDPALILLAPDPPLILLTF